jgi:hypothetical protein
LKSKETFIHVDLNISFADKAKYLMNKQTNHM